MENETAGTSKEFRLDLFGGPRLRRGTTAVRLSPQELTLVALVAAAGSHGMTRDEILDHLWKSGTQATLRPRLAQILHMARQKLGWAEAIVDADRSLILSSDLFSTDLQEYEEALASGRFEEALSLLSLGFLPRLRGAETHSLIQWLEDRQVQLRDQARREVSRALQEAHDQADFARLANLCSLQLRLDPHDEVTLRRLLRAYVALGKPTLAEERYLAFSTFKRSYIPNWEAEEKTQAVLLWAKRLPHIPHTSFSEGSNPSRQNHRLLGRERESEALRNAIAAGSGETGTLITVSGGPGVGKTYLCERVLASALAHGVMVFSAYGSSACSPTEYSVIDQIQDAISCSLGCGGSEDVPSKEPARSQSSQVSGADAYPHFSQLLRVAVSRYDRCVVFVDDIDQADDRSLRLLEWGLRSCRYQGMSVVATLRDPRASTSRLSRLLHSSHNHLPLRLLPLDGGAAEAFIANALPAAPPAVRSMISQRAGGLPRLLSALCMSGPCPETVEETPHSLPVTVKIAVEKTLRDAPKYTRQVMTLLAVESYNWCVADIQQCLSLPLPDTIRALDFLSEIGILCRNDNRISLTSSIFSDYVRSSSAHGLPLTRHQCAQYLEKTTGSPEVLVEAWDLACDPGKTMQYAQQASTHAKLKGDLALNVSHLRRGLRHARGGPQEAEFQSLLGTALLAAREVNEAASLLGAASASAWAKGEAGHWLELQVKLIDAEGHVSGADAADSAARLLDVARTAFRQGCVYPAAKALDRSLHYCHRAGDDQGAATVFRKAGEILRCTSERQAIASLHGTLAMKAYYGDPHSGLEHAALAVRAANGTCSVPERFHVLNRRLAVLLATGRLRCREGKATIKEAMRLSETTADLLQRAHLQINIAVWEADCGNWANSARQLEALIPSLRTPDDKRPLVLALCNLGLASLRCARFAEAGRALEEGEALLTNWDSQEVRAQFAAGLGWVALERGQMRQAREKIAYLDSLSLPTATDITTMALFRARYLRRCGQLGAALEVLTIAIRDTETRFPVHHIGLVCARDKMTTPSLRQASWKEDHARAYQTAETLGLHEWAAVLGGISRV